MRRKNPAGSGSPRNWAAWGVIGCWRSGRVLNRLSPSTARTAG
ncbi:hypothetical protein [Streptosporangium sp. NPDC006007]